MEFTADISKYIDGGVELAKKHPVCTALVAVLVLVFIAIVVIPVIGSNWLDFIEKWKKNKKPEPEESSPVSPEVMVQNVVQPPAEPPAPEPPKPAKLLTRPPVDIVQPLYREQLVAELCQEITAAAQAGKNNKFLLSGFGGVGKTTVARALYRELKSQCEQIGWVECRESGNLKASLLAAIDTGKEKKTDEERFAEIENRLQGCTGQTILFLDNVDQPDELLTELTRYDVTLVVTSRLSEAAGYTSKPIPPLSEVECMELFCSYCSRTVTDEDEPVVRELVRLVSCHTLSVELLAKSVPAKASLAEYLEQLQAKNFGFSDLKFSTGHDNEKDTKDTMVKHLKKLFDMTGLDGEQTRVMQNLALMADSRTLPAEVQVWIGCDENTLAELVNTGWLSQTEDANKRGGYEVHPIVREIVLLDPVPVEAVEKFLYFVAYKNYFQDGEDYRAVQLKLGIAEAVLEQVGDRLEESQDTAALYNNLGNVYADQGKYTQAKECHQKALNIKRKVLGEDHPDTAGSYNNLGIVYGNQGKYAQAEVYHRKARDIRLKVLGEEHLDTAGSYNNLGNVYADQGKYAQARECYQKALNIYRKALGEDHPDTAMCYNNLGNVYDDQGNYDQAEEYYQKALNIYRKVLGEEHPDTASSYNNLGIVYRHQTNYDQAEEYYQKALNIRRKVLGEDHPDTATCYNNLGAVYAYQGKYAQAEECDRKALNIYRRVLGEYHPDTATCYNNLGVVYAYQGKYAQAEECDRKALNIRRKVLGEDHPSTASSYNNLGVDYENQKKYDEAVKLYRKAWKIRQQKLGPDHPDTKQTKNNLRNCFPHIDHGDQDFETWLNNQ